MRNLWDLGESMGSPGSELSLGEITCGFCNERGNIDPVHHTAKISRSTGKTLNYETVKCNACGNYIFVIWSSSTYGGPHGLHAYVQMPWPSGQIQAPEFWPDDVKRFWTQAHQSLDAKAWDAAALMARSALQVVARQQGATGRDLYHEIENLHTTGILPQIMKDFADEVRELGNDSAHPPATGGVATTKDNAEDIVEFLDILLDYIYNLPKKINDYRAKRSAT